MKRIMIDVLYFYDLSGEYAFNLPGNIYLMRVKESDNSDCNVFITMCSFLLQYFQIILFI